jgi:hypothetical protein
MGLEFTCYSFVTCDPVGRLLEEVDSFLLTVLGGYT